MDGLIPNSSIIIPTWNNLPYVQKCVESLAKYSAFKHEIILHINDGSDGTLEWAKQEGLKFSHTPENVGVCVAMNTAYKLATRPLIGYFNDDMVALPAWDWELMNFCDRHGIHKDSWISATMIEPRGDNPCCLAPFDYGQSAETFREAKLIMDLPDLKRIKQNIKGSTWPPNFIHRDLWDAVGGYSEEFSPGFGSDPDLAHKLWNVGVRNFIGVGSSLVYHFICKTTAVKEFPHNNAEEQFRNKYGYSIHHFAYNMLQRGQIWRPT